jgi:hypothetical protein
MIRKVIGLAAAALTAAGLAAGLSGCAGSLGTVSKTYKCTQVVNGKKVPAYCMQDSNGNNFYVSYLLWRQMTTGQPEQRYLPATYWSDTSHEPADDDVPAADHAVSHSVFGGDDGGDGGDHGFSGGDR